jgi:hypothetical protein
MLNSNAPQGLFFILALPKTKQKASASFLCDLSAACWLMQTNGFAHLHLRHLCRTGSRLRN